MATPAQTMVGSSGPVAINASAIRLPPRDDDDIATWFALAELHFQAENLVSGKFKFLAVMRHLSPADRRVVSELIRRPLTDDSYDVLKTTLIARIGESNEQKMRRLLENEPIGDRVPSQFLHHLRSLGGNAVTESVLQMLWMGRLPDNMRDILAASDGSLDKLAEVADRIHKNHAATPVPSTSATSEPAYVHEMRTMISILGDQLKDLTTTIDSNKREINELRQVPSSRDHSPMRSRRDATPSRYRQRSRFRQRSRSRGRSPSQQSFYCWYHYRFGDNAQQCIPPCNHVASSGNARSGR